MPEKLKEWADLVHLADEDREILSLFVIAIAVTFKALTMLGDWPFVTLLVVALVVRRLIVSAKAGPSGVEVNSHNE